MGGFSSWRIPGLALVLAVCVLQQCDASGSMEDFVAPKHTLTQEYIKEFYTETKVVGSAYPQDEKCDKLVLDRRANMADKQTLGVIPTVSLSAALLIFVLVGCFAAGIAQAFQMVRKHVYHDADNLDTAFDAGGKVSIGLTATTIVSQWTWSATLLQSSTVASKYGISGPYWYAGGATIQIIIFSILSIMLKTRAPGAKTFLQVIKARFGKRTHLVFCTFAFFTNLIVMMSLTIAGTAVLNSLVKDLSPELAAMLLATVIGGYTLIGGLGATFYVSYFNTALIFVLILMLVIEVFYNPFNNPENPFGSSEKVYQFISCWRSPEGAIGNRGGSYLTFFSSGGLVFGIVNIVGNFGTVFCDQAYWQSSVAAKPLQGVWGFIFGGLTWFAIPFTLATTMGLAYLGMSSAQGAPLLTEEDVNKGLAAPLVAQKLLGTSGEYAMLFLILMAVMSTGSAEVIAVASIVIYDVYQTYIKPFRPHLKEGQCILCLKPMRANLLKQGEQHLCDCPDVKKCEECKMDDLARAKSKSVLKPHYTCSVHGDFKEYQEYLLNYKNWAIVICTFFSVPLCLFCWAVDLNLAWTYYFTGILIASSVVPIALSILWARATAYGMVSGIIGGCACGMVSWLYYASTYPGGLSAKSFVKNTGEELPMLTGNIVAIASGALGCIFVTYCTRWNMSAEEVEAEWEKTRDIDNPLSPWLQKYKGEMNLNDAENLIDRPPLELVIRKFRTAKLTAYVAAMLFTLLFVVIWPGSMLSIDILDRTGFNAWTTLSRLWAFAACAFITIVPMYQEIKAIIKQFQKNKKDKTSEALNSENSVSDDEESLEMTINDKNNTLSTTTSGNTNQSGHISSKHGHLFQQLRHTVERMLNNISQN